MQREPLVARSQQKQTWTGWGAEQQVHYLGEAAGVVSHVFYSLNHAVNWNQDEPIGICAEKQSATAQHDQDEHRLGHLQDAVQLTVPLPTKNRRAVREMKLQ